MEPKQLDIQPQRPSLNEMMGQNPIMQVHQCMAIVDRKLTRAYFQAVEEVPDLVAKETPVLSFLRREDFHPWNAAERLARYWNLRKRLFEEDDRWLRPMDQSGFGALNSEQIRILRSGYQLAVTPQELPELFRDNDEKNKPQPLTLIADHSLLPEGVNPFQPQIDMYFYTVASCRQIQTREYIVQLLIQAQRKHPPVPLGQLEVAKEMLQAVSCRPGRQVAVHIAEPGRELLSEFLEQRYQVSNKLIYNFDRESTMGYSIEDTTARLEQLGLNRSVMPVALGGKVSKSHFQDWIRMRLSKENILCAGSPKRALSISTFSVCCEEDCRENCNKKVPAGQVSRKRNKLAIGNGDSSQVVLFPPAPVPFIVNVGVDSVRAVSEPATVVGDSQETLPVQHQELTVNATRPYEVLVPRIPGETDDDFRKRRNRFYVSRKVKRENTLRQTLRQEVDALVAEGGRLRAEVARLEAFLCQARLIVAQAQQGEISNT